MAADRGELSSLLKSLVKPGDGLVELRALPGRSRRFVDPRDIRSVLQFAYQHRDENVFFGVAARKDRSSGGLSNCSTIRALFVDLDFKAYPSSEAAVAKVAEFKLPPSFLVHTGGGLHAYWLLEHPVTLPSQDFKSLLRRLAMALGADLSAAEPARILRLPGTLNHKYSPPREVHFVC